MFNGIDLHVVVPGTEVEYEGKKLSVTETNVVGRGRHLYVTQAHYDALMAHRNARKKEPTS